MRNPVTWFEIMGRDSARLQRFYSEVFGWKLTPPVADMGNYSMLAEHGPDAKGAGGGIGDEMGGVSRVSVYIEVDDPQAYLDKASRAGAEVLMPVTTVTPTTTIAMFRDPAGNVNGIMKANPPQKRTARKRTTASRTTTAARTKSTARKKTTARKRTTRRR